MDRKWQGSLANNRMVGRTGVLLMFRFTRRCHAPVAWLQYSDELDKACPHASEGAKRPSEAGRLDARVSQPVLGRIPLRHLKRLTQRLELGNFLPFQFLSNLLKASDGLHRIQAFAATQAYIRTYLEHSGMDTAFEQFLYVLLN